MTDERIDAVLPDDEPRGDEAAEDEVEALRAELEQTRAQFLRARADYQNLERRSQEERREFGRYQITSMVLNLLPVLDDLERALEVGDQTIDGAATA